MEEESWKNFLKYVHYVSLKMSVFKKFPTLFLILSKISDKIESLSG